MINTYQNLNEMTIKSPIKKKNMMVCVILALCVVKNYLKVLPQ